MKNRSLHRVCSLLLLVSVVTLSASAQGNSHNKNSGNTSWTNNGGWDTGNIPGPADTAIINSGTLTISGAQFIGRLRANGGHIEGATGASTDSLTLTGGNSNSEWSDGTIRDLTLIIGQAGALNIESSSHNHLLAAVLEIQSDDGFGLANWTQGTIQMDDGSRIENAGNFDDSANSRIYTFTGTTGQFNNLADGEYNKIGGGTTEIDVVFNNHGVVNIDAGTFILDGGGEMTGTGSFAVDAATILRFDHDYTITNAAHLTGSGQVELTNGTLSLDGDVNVPDFAIKGGFLTGTHTFHQGATWSEGLIKDGATTNDDDSIFNIQSATADNNLSNHTFTNEGTVNWTDGDIQGDNGTTINNAGTFNDALTEDHEVRRFTGANFVFANSGTYHKTGPAKTEFDVTFNNSGTVDVDAGTLVLDGGGSADSTAIFDINAGATLRFDHNYAIADAAALTGEGTFELTGGILDMAGEIAARFRQDGGNIDGDFDIAGTFDWDGGFWNADEDNTATTILSTGILNIDGNSRTYHNRDIVNEGTVNWRDGDLDTNTAGSFTNRGQFNDLTDHDHELAETTGSSVFDNEGTYTKSTTSTTGIRQNFVQDGTLQIQAGRVIFKDELDFTETSQTTVSSGAVLESQNTTHFAGVTLEGGGTYEASSGTLTGSATFNTAFEQSGATLDGAFVFTRDWTYYSGLINDGRHIDLQGTARGFIQPTSLLVLGGGSQVKVGAEAALAWHSGLIRTGGDAGIAVSGLMTTDFDGELNQDSAGDGFLTVSGSFRKTGGSGTTRIEVPVELTGRLESHTGTVLLAAGGTSSAGTFDIFNGATVQISNGFSFNDETRVQNAGTLLLSGGTFALHDDVNLGNQATVSGGTLTGTHSLTGRINVTGGGFDGSGTTTVASGATLEFSQVEDNPLPRSFVNQGRILWSDGDMTGSGGNALTNHGEFAVAGDGTFGSAADDFSIHNYGKFTKTGGTGTTVIDVPFTNHGTLSAETGQFHFTDSLAFGSNATLGGGVQFDAPLTLPSSSTLAGNGTIMGSITTGGTVAPGNSIGSLTITGDLTLLASSTSFFEISASTDPISSDFVSVSGTLTLGGTLSWDLFASLDPVQTDVFTLYSAGTLTGAFQNVANGGRLFAADMNRSFLVNYGAGSAFDPNRVILSDFTFTPIPEPSTWALMMMGLGLIGLRVSRRPRRS